MNDKLILAGRRARAATTEPAGAEDVKAWILAGCPEPTEEQRDAHVKRFYERLEVELAR